MRYTPKKRSRLIGILRKTVSLIEVNSTYGNKKDGNSPIQIRPYLNVYHLLVSKRLIKWI